MWWGGSRFIIYSYLRRKISMKTKIVSAFLLFHSFIFLQAQSNFTGPGIALSFNGDDGNSVDVGDEFNDLEFPFTIEAWMKPENFSDPYSTIFVSDNPSEAYYGFWFRLSESGNVILEMGDGSGSSGSGNRQGRITSESVLLDEWVHVAAICNSDSDVDFYINGVLKTDVSTGGSASISTLTHSSSTALIGNMETIFDSHPFNGVIDEVRLWDDVRTDTEIRENMCKKLGETETNLIGYWKADESYLSSTVADYSASGADGTITGDVEKITSGAAIGDESTSLYTTDWVGVKLKINSDNEDYFRVKAIENNPFGVQIYRVDNNPYFTTGLELHPGYYFGVFPIHADAPATYGISYFFSPTNGVVTEANDETSTLFEKEDASVETWENAFAVIDAHQPFIRTVGNSSRKEIIFNIPFEELSDGSITDTNHFIGTENSNAGQIKIFPNPATNYFILENFPEYAEIKLLNVTGKIIAQFTKVSESAMLIDASVLSAGSYFIQITDDAESQIFKLIIQK